MDIKVIVETEQFIDGKWQSMGNEDLNILDVSKIPTALEAKKILEENIFANFNATLRIGEHKRRPKKIISVTKIEPKPEEDDEYDSSEDDDGDRY